MWLHAEFWSETLQRNSFFSMEMSSEFSQKHFLRNNCRHFSFSSSRWRIFFALGFSFLVGATVVRGLLRMIRKQINAHQLSARNEAVIEWQMHSRHSLISHAAHRNSWKIGSPSRCWSSGQYGRVLWVMVYETIRQKRKAMRRGPMIGSRIRSFIQSSQTFGAFYFDPPSFTGCMHSTLRQCPPRPCCNPT